MTENGSAGTKSSPESGVAGSGQAQAVPQNVASPVSTPVGTVASSKPIFPIGPSQRHSMSHAKRDPGGKTRVGGSSGSRGWSSYWWGSTPLVQPENAAGIMRQLIAFVLLIVSAGRIIEGFRFRTSAAAPWATLRGGVGITVAALTLLSPLSQYIQGDGSRQILGLGLLAYGALGVIGSLAASGERRYRWGALAGDVLAIVLGFLTLTRETGELANGRLFTGVLIVGGVALLVLAYMIRSRTVSEA